MKYAIPDPWLTTEANPFDFDIEGEGRRRQANARGLHRVKPNAAQKAATRREINKWREAAKLSREFNKFKKDYGNAQHEIKKFQRSTTQTLTKTQKALKPIQDAIKKVPGIEKAGKEATRVVDAIKKSQFAKVSSKLAKGVAGGMNAASFALGLAGVGLGLLNLKLTETVTESSQNQLDLYGRELGKQLQIAIKNTLSVRSLEKRVNANDVAIDILSGAVGEKVKYIDRILNEFHLRQDVQKLTQDAQQKLVTGLANTFNQITPVINQTKQQVQNLQVQVRALTNKPSNQNNNNQAQINQLSTRVSSAETKIKQNDKEISGNTKEISNNTKEIDKLKKLPLFPANILQSVKDAISSAQSAVGKVGKLEKELPGTVVKLVDGKVQEVITKNNETLKKELGIEISKNIDKDNLITEIKQRSGDIIRIIEPTIKEVTKPIVDTAIKPIEKVVDIHGNAIGNILEIIGNQDKKIQQNTRRVDKEGIENDKQAIDLEVLKQRVKEQEKVNSEGNKKLDELLKWSLGIPPLLAAIPAKASQQTLDKLRPEIPNLTAQGVCKTLQPGGCTRRGLDDLGNSVNQNTDKKSNNLLDKINAGFGAANAGGNAAIMTVVNRIDAKMGPLLPGGVSTFLQNFLSRFNQVAQWLHLDRVLNVLIWWQTLHNGAMLSNNIFQTLGSGVNNVLAFLGIKDAEGNSLDIGGVVGKAYTDMLKSALGEATYNNLNATFNAANRIYQSVANIANLIQSMQQTILTALEYVGAAQGKVANALKAAGKVFEDAYEWMNVQPNFSNSLFTKLNQFQATASTIEQITQVPVDIKSQIGQLKEESKNMGEALKDGDSALKGLGVIESDKEKEKAGKSKEDSKGKDLDTPDKSEAED